MGYLFDTDAISELLKRRPVAEYLEWLVTVPREEQYTSAIVIGELYRGAYGSPARERLLETIGTRVVPVVTVLPFDIAVAQRYGEIQAILESRGEILADADAQIGATALVHDLELVTGNRRHFARIPGLRLNPVLADARRTTLE